MKPWVFLYLLTDECDSARNEFERAMAIFPLSQSGRISLGIAQRLCHDLDEALTTFDHLVSDFPDVPEIFLNRAYVHISKNDFVSAEKDIQTFLSFESDNLEGLLALTVILSETGYDDRAIAILTDLADKYPSNSIILNNLGLIYYRRGDYTSAMTYWEKSIDLNPNQTEIRQNLRQLRWDHGNFDSLTFF